MTKSRFSGFIPAGPAAVPTAVGAAESAAQETPVQATIGEGVQGTPADLPGSPALVESPRSIPSAPPREERRAFSTRVRPSQKAMLDRYVMELKQAGWPVSQEGVLEELLQMFADDELLRQRITARLTRT